MRPLLITFACIAGGALIWAAEEAARWRALRRALREAAQSYAAKGGR